MTLLNINFFNFIFKTLFKYKEVFWCRFTDHSQFTNQIALKYGGFVYGFVWNKTKPSKDQTVLDFLGKCVYIGQTTGDEYTDKKSYKSSKLYSTCAKRMQVHFNALVNGKSDENKYNLFYENYGYGKNVLNSDEELWLMMIPVTNDKSYPKGFNKIAWALALEAILIFAYNILSGATPLMNMQVRNKNKKDDTYSIELSATKNSILDFVK